MLKAYMAKWKSTPESGGTAGRIWVEGPEEQKWYQEWSFLYVTGIPWRAASGPPRYKCSFWDKAASEWSQY